MRLLIIFTFISISVFSQEKTCTNKSLEINTLNTINKCFIKAKDTANKSNKTIQLKVTRNLSKRVYLLDSIKKTTKK